MPHTSSELSRSMLDWELSRMTELRWPEDDGEPPSRELSAEGSNPSQTEMSRLEVTERRALTASAWLHPNRLCPFT